MMQDVGFKPKLSSLENTPIVIKDKYKHLGIWFDQHLAWNFAIKELAKSASRALGVVISKLIACGGMPYTVYTRLFESLVQPIMLYGSCIWGIAEQRLINNIQNRAMKAYLGVNKYTSNVGVLGDFGWKSCQAKQHMEVFRLYCRLRTVNTGRLLHRVYIWSSRRGNSWEARVRKLGKKKPTF
ncbi:uncharacterized protein [Argopecten irradians]|uniref:uncharacterized protein n=1 Tax=Argopecten irradians TaxID=31199 RepID=UPI003721C906